MRKWLKSTVQWAWLRILPRGVRNSLRLWTMLDTPDRAPRLIENFSNGPILVLAPHQDDEIIGPGGTVALHTRAGAKVTFVFMTDGSGGNAQNKYNGELPAIRKSESRAAAELVGVGELIFLDGPDGALEDTPEMVGKLVTLLEERRPAVVYLPAPSDGHRDHWATNRVFRAALRQVSQTIFKNLIVRGYEVWTPLLANRMADIASVIEVKKKAIDVFVSQTQSVDYARTAVGLSQYRSMALLAGRGFVEAFQEVTAAEYCALFDATSLK